MKNNRFGYTIFLTACIFAGPCEGELPSCKDPRDVLRGTMAGSYVYSASENDVRVRLIVTNTFDETLQGVANFDGTIEITFARSPSSQRSFPISAANLIQAKSYNPTTRILTIDPGDSIRFEVTWNFLDDNGVDVRGFFRYKVDTTCLKSVCPPACPPCNPTNRLISEPEDFALRGSIKIFDKIGTITAISRTLTVCHADHFVPTNCCPPLPVCR